MYDNDKTKEEVATEKENDLDFWAAAKIFQSIAQSTPDSIIISNGKREIVYCNKPAQKLFGYKNGELIGKSILILMPQSIRKSQENNRDEFLEKGISHVFDKTSEYLALKKDGAIFPVEVSHSSVREEPGPFYVAIIRDITERKKIESLLKDSEERLKTIFDNTNDGILIADINTKKFLTGNNKICQMLGYSPKELKNIGITDIHPEEDLPYVIEQFEQQLKQEILIAKNIRVKTKAGNIFFADISSSKIKLEEKFYAIGVFRDITERKQTEEELLKTKDFLEAIFNTSADGIFATNLQGFISIANRATSDITGYTKEELIGKHISDMGFKDQQSKYRGEKLNETLAEKGTFNEYESVWQKKDGSPFFVEYHFAALKDDKGIATGAVAVIRDITEKKKKDEELIETQKELEKRVEERTAELAIKTENLEELNIALRVMLAKRAEDIKDVEEKIIDNIRELVLPYIEKIKNTNLDSRQLNYVNILASNLNDVLSPFLKKMSTSFVKLTPSEIKVANLIKQGKTTKEVAEFMGLSKRTIDFYRENIRKKLGLNKEKTNLSSFLMSL